MKKANRLPLCGMELHGISPSNDLEKDMTEPTKKPRNTTGPLPPATCADRIAKVLAEAPERMAIAEARVADTKLAIANELTRLVQRNTDPTTLPDLLRALKVDRAVALRFGLVLDDDVRPATAEEPSAPDDGIPERLKANVPPADRIEIDRSTGESRRVGRART